MQKKNGSRPSHRNIIMFHEQNSDTKAKGSYIIAIPGIEEDEIRIRKMWYNSVSRYNRLGGN